MIVYPQSRSDGFEAAFLESYFLRVASVFSYFLFVAKLCEAFRCGAHAVDVSLLEMDTTQLGGVDRTCRITKGKVGKDARLLVRERLLTEKDQQADSQFEVDLLGENSGCDLVSRAVAKDQSHQDFSSLIRGFATCTGHTACDALLMGQGTVDAAPRLAARCEDASLIHEAAIGKIAGEQLWKLQTLGLTREEAEERLVAGFLK